MELTQQYDFDVVIVENCGINILVEYFESDEFLYKENSHLIADIPSIINNHLKPDGHIIMWKERGMLDDNLFKILYEKTQQFELFNIKEDVHWFNIYQSNVDDNITDIVNKNFTAYKKINESKLSLISDPRIEYAQYIDEVADSKENIKKYFEYIQSINYTIDHESRIKEFFEIINTNQSIKLLILNEFEQFHAKYHNYYFKKIIYIEDIENFVNNQIKLRFNKKKPQITNLKEKIYEKLNNLELFAGSMLIFKFRDSKIETHTEIIDRIIARKGKWTKINCEDNKMHEFMVWMRKNLPNVTSDSPHHHAMRQKIEFSKNYVSNIIGCFKKIFDDDIISRLKKNKHDYNNAILLNILNNIFNDTGKIIDK